MKDGFTDLRLYTEQINAQITRDFRYAHCRARLLYHFPRLCFYFFRRSPIVRFAMAELVHGNLTFKQLFYKLLWNAPRILLAAPR